MAALGTTSDSLLERAGVAPDALDAAVGAHVIEREDGTLRFTPSAAVVGASTGTSATSAGASTRRIARARRRPRLAARVTSRFRRSTPDAEVAAALDEAVRQALERGASAVAAELRRACAPADAAGRARGAPPAGAGCRSGAPGRRRVDARPGDRDRPAGRDRDRLVARARRSSFSPSWKRRPRGRAARGGPARGGLAAGAAVGHSLSPGVGNALQDRFRPRRRGARARRASSTTTSSAHAPAQCRRSSTGSPARRRRRAISRRWPSTSRRRSAASGWFRRRRRRS